VSPGVARACWSVCVPRAIVDPPVNLNFTHIVGICGGCLANWGRRTRIINYCVDVLDASYEENKLLVDQTSGADLRARRKAQAELYSADIKVGGGSLCAYLIPHTHTLPPPVSSVHNSTTSAPSKRLFGKGQQTV